MVFQLEGKCTEVICTRLRCQVESDLEDNEGIRAKEVGGSIAETGSQETLQMSTGGQESRVGGGEVRRAGREAVNPSWNHPRGPHLKAERVLG